MKVQERGYGMILFIKRIITFTIFSSLIFFSASKNHLVFSQVERVSQLDPLSDTFDFKANTEVYNAKWKEIETIIVTHDNGKTIGIDSFFVGVAYSKFRLSNGKSLSTVMIKGVMTPMKYEYQKKVLWWTETKTEYGMSKQLSFSMPFEYDKDMSKTDISLLDVSPKNVPISSSYTVGINFGVSSEQGEIKTEFGISASKTFTQNSLNIINESNTPLKIAKTSYDYQLVNNSSEALNYVFFETEQRAAYSVSTSNGYYCLFNVFAEFDIKEERDFYGRSLDTFKNTMTVMVLI